MVNSCIAYGCNNRYNKNRPEIRFHQFPFNRQDVLLKWILAVRRANWKPSQYSNLCSQHFKPEDYEPKIIAKYDYRLKTDAVPSIFDYSSPILKPVKKQRLPVKRMKKALGASKKSKVFSMEPIELIPETQVISPSDKGLKMTDKNIATKVRC